MTKKSRAAGPCRQVVLAAALLAIAGSAWAQGTGAGSAKPAAPDEGSYSKWDISGLFGWQFFQIVQYADPVNRFESGWAFGERFGFNVTPKFSFEPSLILGRDRLDLTPSGQNGKASFVTFNTEVAANLVYHFQPRTAKTRYYVKGGPGVVWYSPKGTTTSAGATVVPGTTFVSPATAMQTSDEPALVYGAGVTHYLNSKWGVNFDISGRVNPAAHFGLPIGPTGVGGLYISGEGKNSALVGSISLILRGPIR